MSTFSKTTIVGNLGDDPQITRFDNGGMIATISVATTERWKDKQTGEKKELTEWHRCIGNGKTAELIEKYVYKGQKVLIEGQNRTRKWTDANNIDRYTTEIRIRDIVFLSPKGETGVDNVYNPPTKTEHAGDQFLKGKTEKTSENISQDEEDDLPF